LLPLRDITSSPGQQWQSAVESGQQCRWREHLDPSSGELDGEGQPIQAPTDLGDGNRVVRSQREIWLDGLRACDEEPDRIGRSDIRDAAMAIKLN
jgi:hypothetical protein